MRHRLPMLQHAHTLHMPSPFPPLAVTPTIEQLLAQHAPVAVGVSGGQDSTLTAHLVKEYLDQVGYRGEMLLIYCHLGLIEWAESLVMCQHLAQSLGLELVVLHTDLIARWWKRWYDNVARYHDLRCVKLIMPWSGPGLLRFCTSEAKVSPICQALVRRFPDQTILSVSGIRHDESEQRRNAPICQEQPRLLRKKLGTNGFDWHPIVEWTRDDVLAYHQLHRIQRHKAYTQYGCSRVSCAWCVLSARDSLYGAAQAEENHASYRQLVPLEIVSTFSFKSGLWLAEIAPHLLDEQTRMSVVQAKQRARRREEAEAKLPAHLLYHKGWPTLIPTLDEARLLSEVRLRVAEAVGIKVSFTEPEAIRARYAELMAERERKEAEKARKATRKRSA